MRWALECAGPRGPIDRLVLVQLANAHNAETGQCNPSVPTLAARCCCAERSVRAAIQRLEAAGLVVTAGRTSARRYELRQQVPELEGQLRQQVPELEGQLRQQVPVTPAPHATEPVKNPGTRVSHTRARSGEKARALVAGQGHPAPVERILLAVAAQWPALVAGGHVDIGEAWRRTAGEWTPERVERALDALARMERPPVPGQLLAATTPPRGPGRSRVVDGVPLADGERLNAEGEIERHMQGVGWGVAFGERARRTRATP